MGRCPEWIRGLRNAMRPCGRPEPRAKDAGDGQRPLSGRVTPAPHISGTSENEHVITTWRLSPGTQ
jgi:hypothetical protein